MLCGLPLTNSSEGISPTLGPMGKTKNNYTAKSEDESSTIAPSIRICAMRREPRRQIFPGAEFTNGKRPWVRLEAFEAQTVRE
jgi:hypothetical protein